MSSFSSSRARAGPPLPKCKVNALRGFRTRPARAQSSEALTPPDPAEQPAEDGRSSARSLAPIRAGTLATLLPAAAPAWPAGPRETRARPPSPGLPHLVVPGRVAPQHLAPHGHLEGPVGQLRLRRLLLPPPAAHPPVAPPELGVGRAGRAKGSRGLGWRVLARGAAATVRAARSRGTPRFLSLRQAAGSPAPRSMRHGGRGGAPRRAHAANRRPLSGTAPEPGDASARASSGGGK